MTKQEIEKWEGTPAKAVYAVAVDCCMEILGFDGNFCNHVIVKGFCGDIHRYLLHSNSKGSYFTYCNGCRYYIRDFLKL